MLEIVDKIPVILNALPYILQGGVVTLITVIGSLALGFCIGLPLAVLQVYGPSFIRRLIGVYVWFFRGMPILLLLFLFYFGLFEVIGLNLSTITASCLVLGMASAAYQSQIFRGSIETLPVGQFRAARALAMDPKVMLLDEPTSALDPELVGEVLSVIRDLADGGMTMIMATHQMDFARALATDILFMEQGKIIEQGAPDVLLAPGSGTRTSDFCGKLFDLRGTEKSDEPTVSELLTGDLSHDITDDGSESSMIPDAPKKD